MLSWLSHTSSMSPEADHFSTANPAVLLETVIRAACSSMVCSSQNHNDELENWQALTLDE